MEFVKSPSQDSFTRTLMIMKNNSQTLSTFYQISSTLHRYRGAILFWIYLMAIVIYATRLVEY